MKNISTKSDLSFKGLESPLSGNTKGGSFTVPLTSCLTGLDYSVLQMKTKIVSCHTADSKPVKQEVNGTMIPPPLLFPALTQLTPLGSFLPESSFTLTFGFSKTVTTTK
jgi:hypothetical protein